MFSEPLGSYNSCGGFEVAYEVVHHILEKVENRIERKKAFRETLKSYMKVKTKGNIKEVGNMHFFACKADSSPFSMDFSEPYPLGSDCLLPKAADIDH